MVILKQKMTEKYSEKLPENARKLKPTENQTSTKIKKKIKLETVFLYLAGQEDSSYICPPSVGSLSAFSNMENGSYPHFLEAGSTDLTSFRMR